MFSDLIYTWHARLYAEQIDPTMLQFQSHMAPQISHLFKEKLDKDVPLAVDMVLRTLEPRVNRETHRLFEDFGIEWQEQPAWSFADGQRPELFKSGNHLFVNPYFGMHGLGYLPIEITPITVESVPDGWELRSSHCVFSKEYLEASYKPDDLILHVRILPEYLFCHFLFTQHRTDVCQFGKFGNGFEPTDFNNWPEPLDGDQGANGLFGRHYKCCRELDGYFPLCFTDYANVTPLEMYGSARAVVRVLMGESDPAGYC